MIGSVTSSAGFIRMIPIAWHSARPTPAISPIYLFPWMFSKSSSGIVRLNCIATMIPKKIKKHPKSSIIEGSVCKNISAKMIVKGICKENNKACLLGPSLLRQTNKNVSPIIMPITEDKNIAMNIDLLK